MNRVRVLLLAAFIALATGCGKAPESPAPAQPAAETAQSAPPAPVAEPAPAEDAVPAAAAAASAAESAVEESAGTEAASPAEQNPLGKDIVLPKAPASAPTTTNWQYPEGEYYNTLPAAQGTSTSAGKIEVAEVFWYGCGHCYNLEPVLSDWVKKLPPDVNFVRVPVMWNPVNEMHGRAYYAAEALGKGAEISTAIFRAIHLENQPLTEEKDLQKLFAANGVSEADFNRTFRSFSVESQLKRAKDLTVKYRVRGVPLLVVNGKYTTDGPKIGSHQDLLAVTEELVQRERQRN